MFKGFFSRCSDIVNKARCSMCIRYQHRTASRIWFQSCPLCHSPQPRNLVVLVLMVEIAEISGRICLCRLHSIDLRKGWLVLMSERASLLFSLFPLTPIQHLETHEKYLTKESYWILRFLDLFFGIEGLLCKTNMTLTISFSKFSLALSGNCWSI